MRYKHECARRIQRFWRNNAEGIQYAQMRDYGHQILAGRKERRRFSLLSYRRFAGDYLDVNGKDAFGEELNTVCGLGGKKSSYYLLHVAHMVPAEPAAFSCRIQLLISKLGRSSKPSPRFLVLVCSLLHRRSNRQLTPFQTSKAVYIVVTNQRDGRTQRTVERKIPLVTIRSIAMSNLRDDWMVRQRLSACCTALIRASVLERRRI